MPANNLGLLEALDELCEEFTQSKNVLGHVAT